MRTKRTIGEIEVALAKKFDYIRNLVVFNVNGWSEKLPIYHECDMLSMSKRGYLTEVEIKRTWSDFLADFKKTHKHDNRGIIKYFYYCIPKDMLEKAYDKLSENNVTYSGIITYNEDLYFETHPYRSKDGSKIFDFKMKSFKALDEEGRFELARLGAIRIVGLKEKINRLNEKLSKVDDI